MRNIINPLIFNVLIIGLVSTSYNVSAENSFVDALTGGKVDFGLRLRYEHVDDDRAALTDNTAEALTNRTILGYKTGDFHNMYAHVEFENVADILDDTQYNDGENGLGGSLPTIADPRGTEVNQAYLGLKFIENTHFKVGRQILTPRKAPFHRYLGTVLWRQNWQTQDAVTVTNTSIKDTELLAGYIWKNNTIFRTDRDLEAPIFNVKYKGFKYAKLEGYYYDLDFTEAADFANAVTTYGIRANGGVPIFNDKTKFIYTGEFATQSDTGSNPRDYDVDYYLLEGGFKMNLDSFVNMVMVKFSHEVLEHDLGTLVAGGAASGAVFRTPLATGHAFQGWADNFLTAPGTGATTGGIEDNYFTMVATGKYNTKLIISYHMLEAETGSYDYGDEFDIWFTKKFKKKYTLGIKYAAYDASSDAGNTTKATDLSKFWVYLAYKY
jgi:hypothetical protein